jgi:tetratricopeptide (TPR) repeat protein
MAHTGAVGRLRIFEEHPAHKTFWRSSYLSGLFLSAEARAWRIFFRGIAKEYDGKPDFPGAEQRFRETLQISPKLFFAGIELGNLLAARGARQEAIQVYEEARRYAPPTEDIGSVLKRQIERISTEDPKTVPPVRDPYME